MGNLDPDYMDQEFDPGNRYTLLPGGADAIIVNTMWSRLAHELG